MSWVCATCSNNNTDTDESCLICGSPRPAPSADADKTCTLTERRAASIYGGEVFIPDEFNVIGENAFKGRTDITAVYIHSGVKTIKRSAFEGCTYLSRVHADAKLNSIGARAFAGCTYLCPERRPAASRVAADAYEGCSTTYIDPPSRESVPTRRSDAIVGDSLSASAAAGAARRSTTLSPSGTRPTFGTTTSTTTRTGTGSSSRSTSTSTSSTSRSTSTSTSSSSSTSRSSSSYGTSTRPSSSSSYGTTTRPSTSTSSYGTTTCPSTSTSSYGTSTRSSTTSTPSRTTSYSSPKKPLYSEQHSLTIMLIAAAITVILAVFCTFGTRVREFEWSLIFGFWFSLSLIPIIMVMHIDNENMAGGRTFHGPLVLNGILTVILAIFGIFVGGNFVGFVTMLSLTLVFVCIVSACSYHEYSENLQAGISIGIAVANLALTVYTMIEHFHMLNPVIWQTLIAMLLSFIFGGIAMYVYGDSYADVEINVGAHVVLSVVLWLFIWWFKGTLAPLVTVLSVGTLIGGIYSTYKAFDDYETGFGVTHIILSVTNLGALILVRLMYA